MFENIMNFFKRANKKEGKVANNSKTAAKERLHLVLMQDRANVSADFLELMKQEIIEVIKKYIEVDESAIDVRLTNKENEDGTNGAPALYANIPILNIKNEARKIDKNENKTKEEKTENKEVDNQKTENKAEEEKTENKETDNQKTETKSKENNSEAEENKKENENNNKSKKAEENKETKSENNKTKKVKSEKKEKVKTEE